MKEINHHSAWVLLWIVTSMAGLALAVKISRKEIDAEWDKFKKRYGRSYEDEETEVFRKKIFREHYEMFERINELYDRGEIGSKLEINELSDKTLEELFPSGNARVEAHHKLGRLQPRLGARPPKKWDWRKKGAITPIKNQGACGSCYAFAALGALEAQIFIKKRKLVDLSAQQIVDCSIEQGNAGCASGGVPEVYECIMASGGIASERSYPYEARNGSCRYRKEQSEGIIIKQWNEAPKGDEATLANIIAKEGPVAVAINVTTHLHGYKEGVYDCHEYGEALAVHMVLLVGYGTTESGEDFYLVKNSYGTKWGQGGYGMFARNRRNACGITNHAFLPVL